MSEDQNLSNVKAGDIDPSTGKKILYIAYQAETFLVSIDDSLNLNWTTGSNYGDNRYAHDFGEVVGSCTMADALVDRIFIGKRNRLAYKKMLGEVIGRVLDDHTSTSAKKLLRIVDERLTMHCKERVRMAYIYYAFGSVCGLAVVAIALASAQDHFKFFSADGSRYRIIVAAFLGGVGAFITTFARFQNYTGSLVAGLPIHRLDGFLRIFYGVVAGLIVTLAIKGNVLIGFAESSMASQPWLGYFLAMVGGASEALIPNLISQTENNLRIKTTADDEEAKKNAAEFAKLKAELEALKKEKDEGGGGDTQQETEETETDTENTTEPKTDIVQNNNPKKEPVATAGSTAETTTEPPADEEKEKKTGTADQIKLEIIATPKPEVTSAQSAQL